MLILAWFHFYENKYIFCKKICVLVFWIDDYNFGVQHYFGDFALNLIFVFFYKKSQSKDLIFFCHQKNLSYTYVPRGHA